MREILTVFCRALTATCLYLCVGSFSATAQTKGIDNSKSYSYYISSDNLVFITGVKQTALSSNDSTVTIPEHISVSNTTYMVNGILNGLYGQATYGYDSSNYNMYNIKRLIIETPNLTIGQNTFCADDGETPSLETVSVSGDGSIAEIEQNAFYQCSTLTTFPSTNVKEIGKSAFYQCTNLADFTNTSSKLKIGSQAFWRCTNLKSFKNTGGVTEIGANAFAYCLGLSYFSVDTISTIGNAAFIHCQSLTAFDFTGVTSIGTQAFHTSKLSSVNLPNTVTSIGEKAFYNCRNLTDVTCSSSSIKTIPSELFSECANLKTITFSALSEIGSQAFYNCSSLTEFDFTGVTSVGEQAFMKSGLASVYLPHTVTSVGANAFSSCISLKSATLTNGFNLSENMFLCDTALKHITIEESTTDMTTDGATSFRTVGQSAFEGCTSLTSITIPEGIGTIYDAAFRSCKSLKSITFPSLAHFDGTQVIDSCQSLQTIKHYGTECDGNMAENLANLNPNSLTLLAVDTASYRSKLSSAPQIDVKYIYAFDGTKTDEATGETTATISDTTSVADALTALNSGLVTNVEMANDITFSEISLDLETLSADNIFTVLDKLPTVTELTGSIKGSTISNLAARTSGLFGTVDGNAAVDGLTLNNATLYFDLNDDEAVTKDENGICLHLLAKENRGSITNFGFKGSIIVDENLASGSDISICVVDSVRDGASLTGFVYIDDLETTGSNKRCITIKQNLGVRNSPTAKIKMAKQKLRQSGSNKSLDDDFEYAEDELNQSIREFDDDEFASGVVAYWLNFDGPGHTGNYTGRWSQGKSAPIASTTKNGVSNALYAVDYGTTDISHITSGSKFANNGSTITIYYDETPESITVGDTKLASFGAESVTLTFDHTKAINIKFAAKDPTATNEPDQKICVSVSGYEITISGAEGAQKALYDASGVRLSSTTGDRLSAPAVGLYIVRTGDKTTKVLVK